MADYKQKNRNNPIEQISIQAGKMPPQAVELEEAVLGAVMLEKDAITPLLDLLKPESFYKDAHRLIFEAIVNISKRLDAIDILTVTEELRKQKKLEEIGGPLYITQLTSKVASAAHLEFHARIIAQKFIQRELIRVSSEIQSRAFDENEDVDELLDFSEAELFSIAQGSIKKEASSINAILKVALEQIEEASKRETGLSGVPSGYTGLDRYTSGWQRSDLVIIAARPSMGKTAFVLTMARNIAVEHKRGVAFFSLEMSSVQLANRLIVSETELSSDKIRNGNLKDYEWEQLEYKIKNLSNAPIFIDDTPSISIFELRAKCRRLKSQHNIELIVIDYLQLMTGSGDSKGNREQEVSTISRALKALAKDLDVPVIALSQLNRSVEMRSGDKRPQLSDLRESGAIEQDADMVLFINRPEHYGITEDEEGNPTKGKAEVILAKHRNGATGLVEMRFRKEFAQFLDVNMFDMADGMQDDQGSLTVGSKMNQENSDLSNDDLQQNTNFENENNSNNTPF